ncbi:MAG: hypothetical protein Q8916_12160 [Bacteroidota bacterium]|nr:hypothetical protein [Bacteroidota bacterium]MDP4231146.1 hypothetical protein [Bacteroidota bacterium]MDP4236075.1 hypothetical protein [Bacteroidota bacterium]
MKAHHSKYAVVVLFLIAGTVHAQVTETMPGVYIDLDTVTVSPAQKWFVDSFCVAREIKLHEALLEKYKTMPDRYFESLNKRLLGYHQYTREELIATEDRLLIEAKKKIAIYHRAYEVSLALK